MKNKRVWVPIIIGVLVGGVGAGIFLWSKQPKTATPTTVPSAPTPMPVEQVTWTDPAGFTFGYPKDISVNPHEEDTVNYANVELTHKDHPGRIVVWMKDLPAPNISGASVLDTTLGGKPAKKILVSDPAKKLMVFATDNDVYVSIEGELVDEAYWSDIHQKVVDSFVFAPPESSGGGGGSVEEEEVVE